MWPFFPLSFLVLYKHTGVVAGITVFFIAVLIFVITLFLIIISRGKRTPKQNHQQTYAPTHNELELTENSPKAEGEPGYATVPYVFSLQNENFVNHKTPTSNNNDKTGEDKCLSVNDGPTLPDCTFTNKSTDSDNIYDNYDDIELMKKKKTVVSVQQQGEKKHKDGNEDEDEEGYVAMGPVAEENKAIHDQSHPEQTTE